MALSRRSPVPLSLRVDQLMGNFAAGGSALGLAFGSTSAGLVGEGISLRVSFHDRILADALDGRKLDEVIEPALDRLVAVSNDNRPMSLIPSHERVHVWLLD